MFKYFFKINLNYFCSSIFKTFNFVSFFLLFLELDSFKYKKLKVFAFNSYTNGSVLKFILHYCCILLLYCILHYCCIVCIERNLLFFPTLYALMFMEYGPLNALSKDAFNESKEWFNGFIVNNITMALQSCIQAVVIQEWNKLKLSMSNELETTITLSKKYSGKCLQLMKLIHVDYTRNNVIYASNIYSFFVTFSFITQIVFKLLTIGMRHKYDINSQV